MLQNQETPLEEYFSLEFVFFHEKLKHIFWFR